MNRIMGRVRILVILILVLSLGTGFFVWEYLTGSAQWILHKGSPHIYNADNIGCGVFSDREGNLLLDLTGGRTYANNLSLRRSIIHWLGDREGNISAPALAYYARQIAGFDPINGVYAYGGIGGQVQLTLSAQLQIAALEAMGDYTGTIAIVNYETGEVLCAVSTPNFDPDKVPDIAGDTEGKYEGVYLNRFVQSTYTPGSIYKIVTTAAALETIPDIQQQTFTCEGTLAYGVDKVTCEKRHGKLTLKEAFACSCNCAFAQISNQVGGTVLQRYAQQFGLTQGISFDGITTVAGSLQAEGEPEIFVAWSGIGQHKDLINPCSYLAFVSAIANDGVLNQPYLVSSIRVGMTQTYQANASQGVRILSTQTARILQEYLRNNVENYYGADLFPGLTVCAKSGTAEVGGGKKPNAMFTGFVDDAQCPLAFLVVIEDGGYGKQTCVPVLAPVLALCRELFN